MTQRASYYIDERILDRFNRLVPERKRSQTVQDLLSQHVAFREKQIENAAWLIEHDPDYVSIKEVSVDADAMAVETFARMDASEQR